MDGREFAQLPVSEQIKVSRWLAPPRWRYDPEELRVLREIKDIWQHPACRLAEAEKEAETDGK